jgi:hypothetical protein
MPHALQFLVLTVAGWLNRHQEDLIDYLREEIASSASNLVPDRVGSQTPSAVDSRYAASNLAGAH